MGATVSHGLSATTPDNTSYEIRPSHWNDTHAVTFAQNWTALGNTTQSTSGSGDGMVISGAGLASVGVSNNSLIISVPAGAPSPVNFSAGTTSGNLGSVVFSNSNGVSFGLNGSTITGSVQRSKSYYISGNTVGAASSTLLESLGFVLTGEITGSWTAGSVQLSVPATVSGLVVGNVINNTSTVLSWRSINYSATGEINIGFSDQSLRFSVPSTGSGLVAGNTIAGGNSSATYFYRSLNYSATGNISGAYSADSLRLSVPVDASVTLNGNTTHSSTGTYAYRDLRMSGAGIASVGISSGTIIVSVPAGAPSPVNFSAGTTSNNLGSVVFSNSNGVSFGLNGSTITASVAPGGAVVSNAIQSVGSATGSGTNTSRFAADDHVHAGVFSMGVTNAGNTVGDTRVDVGRFVLQGGNSVTLSQITAANALNTIVISGANQTNQTGISGVGVSDTTYSSGTVIWSAQANVTLNSSVNGASQYVRISVAAPGGGAGVTLSGYRPGPNYNNILADAFRQASMAFHPVQLPAAVQFDRMAQIVQYTQATNSTLTVTVSWHHGFYTKNGSTMSLAHSESGSFSINGSGTASSEQNSGLKIVTLPWTTTIPAGNYYAGMWWRSTTAGNNATFSMFRHSQIGSNYAGVLGEGTHNSNHDTLGIGEYSATFSTAIPSSIAFSDLIASASANRRFNASYYASGTA